MAKGNETSTQEEVVQQAQVAQQAQARPCPQDCRMCGMSQQLFCTTKMLFDMSRTMQVLGQQVAAVETAIFDLQTQMQKKDEEAGQLSIPFAE